MNNKPSDIVPCFFTVNNNVSCSNIILKGLIYTSLFLLFKLLRSHLRQLVNTFSQLVNTFCIKRGWFTALVNTFTAITTLFTEKVITFYQKVITYFSKEITGNKKVFTFNGKVFTNWLKVFTYNPGRSLFRTFLFLLNPFNLIYKAK